MKNFYIFLITILLSFSGCTGASEENADKPTITLKGDRDIVLKIGTVMKNDLGYSAYDQQDGDLTGKVIVNTNVNFHKEGNYYINYEVSDKDGNKANASRNITVNKVGLSDELYGDNYNFVNTDTRYYDLADYEFIYQVYEEGKSASQKAYEYDSSGTLAREYSINYERNKNDKSIYKYIDNSITKRTHIGFDDITSVDKNNNVSKYNRQARVNDTYTFEGMSCHIVEHLSPFQTSSVANLQGKNFNYFNVIHTQCDDKEIYFASGWGEILRVDGGVYTIYDKNSMQVK